MSIKTYLRYIRERWGPLRVDGVEPKNVLTLRDTYADLPPAPPAKLAKPLEDYLARPAAANALVRALSAMLSWGVPRGWRRDNPCRHVPKLSGGDRYAPWSWDDIEYFARIADPRFVTACALALYTGQRQGDVLSMKRSEIRDGLVSVVTQEKTGKKLWIPMHRNLAPFVADIDHSAVTILANTEGEPWTNDGFRASWNRQLARPEFEDFKERRLVFHGLRKSAVVMLLEAGCTDAEVSAITGQTREMVEHYARQVNQRKLASAAILKWETYQPGNKA